jgi:hypothetical protein
MINNRKLAFYYYYMKYWVIILLLLAGCTKEKIITSPDAKLSTSENKIYFDTVFTTAGSVTKTFKIVNENNQRLRISNIQLAGGASSYYKINVDGSAGTQFTNTELAANDSLYVFVKLNINPAATNLPFLVKDSIRIDYNSNTKWVNLEAYGQNAIFLRNDSITTNTVWTNNLPYVISGGLTIKQGRTLTLQKGTRIYCNAGAPIFVYGNLIANGEKYDSTRVVFRGDRTDADYKDYPGGWPGILVYNTGSLNFTYAKVLNAYQAIVAGGANITLNETIIDNAYDIGLAALASTVNMRNCLISNCGNDAEAGAGGSNVIIRDGGTCNINHCTIVTFANAFQIHKQPALYLHNTSTALTCTIRNSIIYGLGGLAENEIITAKGSGAFNVTMQNVLYKVKTDPANISFTAPYKNILPEFDTINTFRREYNFRLRTSSPAIDKGEPTGINFDLDGNPRIAGTKPDIGCYEKQ